jgi:hypothetical protein
MLPSDVSLIGRDREIAIIDGMLASISERGSSAIIRSSQPRHLGLKQFPDDGQSNTNRQR